VFVNLLPGAESTAKAVAYGTALLLAVGAVVLYYFRRRGQPGRLLPRPGQVLPRDKALLRGLLPFEDGDALIGRDTEIQDLLTILLSKEFRFGVVWGRSGCGKTSLLRAGFLPALRKANVRPFYVGRPAGDPREGICAEVRKELPPGGVPADDLAALLAAHGGGLARYVLVIDQFEEFFLINRTKEAQAPFRAWLGQQLRDSGLPLAVLIGIREDFFARLHHLAPDVPDPTNPRCSYEIEDLTAAKAKEVLATSLEKDNSQFELGLIDRLVDGLQVEGRVRPPELQLIATHLKRRGVTRLNEYEALGGSDGILRGIIEEEIRHTPNAQLTRVVLRKLCSPEAPTRSPLDISMTELVAELTAKGLASPGVEVELQMSLERLVNSRIVLRTDEDRYNLVHDYLAPMVKAATEGTETPVERANRLARRYIAEFKGDRQARIPLRHLLLIQRHADRALLDSAAGRSLRLRSAAHAAGSLLLPPAAILAAVLVLCYGLLSTSFYLSTASSDYQRGSPKVVVRAGNPNLKFLPGFKGVLTDTGYTMRDMDPDQSDVIDLIPREQIGGFRWSRTNGYSTWMEQVVKGLLPLERARARRLLGTPVSARDEALALMKDPKANRLAAAQSLGIVGKADRAPLSQEFVRPIKELLAPDVDVSTRLAAAVAIGGIAQDQPEIREPEEELFREVWGLFETKLRDKTARNLSWELDPYEAALISLVMARSVSDSKRYADKLVQMRADKEVDAFAQWNVLSVAQAFAKANPEAAEVLIEGLLKIAFPEGGLEIRSDSASWLTIDTTRAVVAIGRAVPGAITTRSTASLREVILKGNDPRTSVMAPLAYGLLVQSNPSAAHPEALEAVEGMMRKEGASDDVKASCAITLARLALARQMAPSPPTISVLQDFYKKCGGEDDGNSPTGITRAYLRLAVTCVLVELAGVDSQSLADLRLGELVSETVSAAISHHGSEIEDRDIREILLQGAKAGHAAVGEGTVEILLGRIEEPREATEPGRAALGLVALARWAPDAVLNQRDRLHKIKGHGFDPENELRQLQLIFQTALARARYEKERARDRSQLVPTLLAWLKTGEDSDLRVAGSCGLYFLTLEDTGSRTEVEQALLALRQGHEPHVRMAASRALEMIRVGEFAAEARRERRQFSLNRARGEFFLKHPEHHIQMAAQVALEYMRTPPR
jgi:hypothetical protein